MPRPMAKLRKSITRASSAGFGWTMRTTSARLGDVPMDARIMNEEPFGPVAVMSAFRDYGADVLERHRVSRVDLEAASEGGERLVAKVPHGHWKRMTFIAGPAR